MLSMNKSGRKLIEYINITENNMENYYNITSSLVILIVQDKFVIGYNKYRNQWEFPAGHIEKGETLKQTTFRELFEETHQRVDNLKFKGLFRIEDNKKIIKYQAIYIGYKSRLSDFIYKDNDEMKKIYLWNLKENIGYVDA